jgi:hypothetical protein
VFTETGFTGRARFSQASFTGDTRFDRIRGTRDVWRPGGLVQRPAGRRGRHPPVRHRTAVGSRAGPPRPTRSPRGHHG